MKKAIVATPAALLLAALVSMLALGCGGGTKTTPATTPDNPPSTSPSTTPGSVPTGTGKPKVLLFTSPG
ncbi:MAG: hypothetical protein V1748_04475 [Actinomycetota bacterium]